MCYGIYVILIPYFFVYVIYPFHVFLYNHILFYLFLEMKFTGSLQKQNTKNV